MTQGRLAGLPAQRPERPAEIVVLGGQGAGVLRLRRWSARFAGGQFRGDASFRVGDDRSFSSDLTLTGLDLEPIARAFNPGPRPASGRVSGQVSSAVRTPSSPSATAAGSTSV